jgi:hypothetical protein
MKKLLLALVILLMALPAYGQWSNYNELDEAPAQTDDLIVRDKSDTSMASTGTQKRLEIHNLFLSHILKKTAAYTCTVDDNGTIFTNYGTTTTVVFTLPECTSSTEGWWAVFEVASTYAVRLTPNANDSFRLLSPGAAGNYITSDTTEGSKICVRCMQHPSSGTEADTYNWENFGSVGTWTAQ